MHSRGQVRQPRRLAAVVEGGKDGGELAPPLVNVAGLKRTAAVGAPVVLVAARALVADVQDPRPSNRLYIYMGSGTDRRWGGGRGMDAQIRG
jgi:hypothetical protein